MPQRTTAGSSDEISSLKGSRHGRHDDQVSRVKDLATPIFVRLRCIPLEVETLQLTAMATGCCFNPGDANLVYSLQDSLRRFNHALGNHWSVYPVLRICASKNDHKIERQQTFTISLDIFGRKIGWSLPDPKLNIPRKGVLGVTTYRDPVVRKLEHKTFHFSH